MLNLAHSVARGSSVTAETCSVMVMSTRLSWVPSVLAYHIISYRIISYSRLYYKHITMPNSFVHENVVSINSYYFSAALISDDNVFNKL